GSLRARLQHLVYWPLAVCLVATPAFGLLGLWGSVRALRRLEPGWDLVALAWLPAAYFTFRAAILLDFRPMARFTLVAASLSLVSGIPEEQWIRSAWKGDFEQRLARKTPTLAVLVVRGSLGDFTRERFDFRGLLFCAAQRFTYATVYRSCAPGHTR